MPCVPVRILSLSSHAMCLIFAQCTSLSALMHVLSLSLSLSLSRTHASLSYSRTRVCDQSCVGPRARANQQLPVRLLGATQKPITPTCPGARACTWRGASRARAHKGAPRALRRSETECRASGLPRHGTRRRAAKRPETATTQKRSWGAGSNMILVDFQCQEFMKVYVEWSASVPSHQLW